MATKPKRSGDRQEAMEACASLILGIVGKLVSVASTKPANASTEKRPNKPRLTPPKDST